jgi:hypothetical protein
MKSMRNSMPPVRPYVGSITQAVFTNYRTLDVIPWCPFWSPFTTRGRLLGWGGICAGSVPPYPRGRSHLLESPCLVQLLENPSLVQCGVTPGVSISPILWEPLIDANKIRWRANLKPGVTTTVQPGVQKSAKEIPVADAEVPHIKNIYLKSQAIWCESRLPVRD